MSGTLGNLKIIQGALAQSEGKAKIALQSGNIGGSLVIDPDSQNTESDTETVDTVILWKILEEIAGSEAGQVLSFFFKTFFCFRLCR